MVFCFSKTSQTISHLVNASKEKSKNDYVHHITSRSKCIPAIYSNFWLSASLPQPTLEVLLCYTTTRIWAQGGLDGSLSKKAPKKSIDQMYDVIWSNWQTQKVLKQKPWINWGLSTVCFQNSPAESSDASPPSQSLPHSSLALSITPSLLSPSPTICPHPFLFCLLSVLFSLSLSLPPPETKCLKRKERTPFLLISWGLNRRRICCLSFSSAVHGLSTVLWSWACVAKSRRKKQGRHTQMPQWRSWTGLRWGLSSKWGPIISI